MAYKFLKIGNSVREAWATLSDVISNIRGTGNTTLTDLHSDVSGVTNISNSIDSKIGTFTDSAETVAHKLDNLQFDKSDLAKVGTDSGATNTAILESIIATSGNTEQIKNLIGTPTPTAGTSGDTLFKAIEMISSTVPTETKLKLLYSARFETNGDGENTVTLVLPLVATITESSGDTILTI